jgi:hypothetical protein
VAAADTDGLIKIERHSDFRPDPLANLVIFRPARASSGPRETVRMTTCDQVLAVRQRHEGPGTA